MIAERQWLDRRQPEPGTNTYGPIGVYFTQHNLHLVQLEKFADGAVDIRAHAAVPFPGTRTELMAAPAAVAKLIRRGMRQSKFRGRKVVSAMPPEQVRVMSVSYPAGAGESAAASIAKLMADRVEGPLTDYVIDYVPIRVSAHDGDRLALVAVSSLEDANAYLDSLAAAGLHVDFLEIGPIAIKRLISFGAKTDLQDHVFVLNVGATSTNLTTISGERLLADQELEFGEQRVLGIIADSLDLTENMARDLIFSNGLDQSTDLHKTSGGSFDTSVVTTLIDIVRPEFLRLVREIERAFLFADSESHGNSRKKIIVAGNIAQWPGAAALLGSLTQTPVESLGRSHLPFAGDGDGNPDISDQLAAEMSTAVGLALRGMTDDE
jgi:Tfp pilus assembly PilM family ATPase